MAKLKTYSVQEFHKQFCHLTGLRKRWSEAHIRRACRGDIDPRTGKKTFLPEGWQASKLPGQKSWMIYKIAIPSMHGDVIQEKLSTFSLLERQHKELSKIVNNIPPFDENDIEPIFTRPSQDKASLIAKIRKAQFAITRFQRALIDEMIGLELPLTEQRGLIEGRCELFDSMNIELPEQIEEELACVRRNAVAKGTKYIVQLEFEKDGSVKGELLHPSDSWLFLEPVACIFFCVWLSMSSDSKIRDARSASKVWKQSVQHSIKGITRTDESFLQTLTINRFSEPVYKAIPDFEKRCIGCTKYRPEGSKSLFCEPSCRDSLSNFLKSLNVSKQSDEEISKRIVARLKKLGLLLKG